MCRDSCSVSSYDVIMTIYWTEMVCKLKGQSDEISSKVS